MMPKRLRACGLPRGPNMRMRLFGRRAGRLAELLEADRRLDVVAQDRLAGVDIAGEHGVDAFAQQRFAECGSPLIRFCTSSLKFPVNAIVRLRSSRGRLAAACNPPTFPRLRDVALLALLGAARQQDHQRFAVAPEIHPVARPPIDPVFEHPLAHGFAFEMLPCSSRTIARETFARAVGSSPRTTSRTGSRPSPAR